MDFGETPIQVFVAGDDEVAKERVSAIAERMGFAPVNAGPLANARYIEPLAQLNIQLGYVQGRGTQIAPVWIERSIP